MALRIDVQVAGPRSGLPEVAKLRHWARSALAGRRRNAELSIRIVEAAESRALNRRFRGQDRPTNVLAFPADLPADLKLPLLGDLVICREIVESEAAVQAKPLDAHWAHMIVHGTLHLLGFDHESETDAAAMEALEAEILAEFGWPDPYRERDTGT